MNAVVPALPMPSFAAKFAPAEESRPPKSFLLYGDKGTQKTLSLGQIVRDGFFEKMLYIDLDNSSEVWATDKKIMAALADGRINRISINSFDPNSRMEIEGYILEVAGMWRDPSGSILPNPNIPDFGFDIVAIDTVNMMHEVALKQLMATTYNDKGTALDGRAAYGKVAIWMDEMIRLIHTSKRFTGGFVMHAKTIEDVTGISKIKPKLSGSFKDSIATIPSIVAYLDKEKHPDTGEVVLTATVGNSDLCDSGNRYSLPDKIYDFNLVRMYRTIYESIDLPLPAAAVQTLPAAPVADITPAAAAA